MQKENTADNGGERFSLWEFELDGRRYVEIDQDQDRFAGKDPGEYPRIAKDIINEKFNGRVIGDDQKMFVNGAGRDEFSNPSKRISDDLYEAKMRTAGELDNLLDAGTNLKNKPDGEDGHIHPDVVDGFDHLDTLFKIGSRWFSARVNIKNISRGKLFKDVTQIKEVTQDIMSSYGSNPKSQFLRTSSRSSIRAWIEKVNKKIQAVLDKVSPNHAEQMRRYTELKDSDHDAAQRIHDELMDGPYAADFGEYLSLIEQLEKLEAEQGRAPDSATEDGTGSYTERPSIDDEVRYSLDDTEVDVDEAKEKLVEALRDMTPQQKAALWQLVTGSTSAKNNPYSKDVGQKVIDAISKLKDEEESDDTLSFSDEIMRQLMGRA